MDCSLTGIVYSKEFDKTMPQKKYHVDLTDDERTELEKLLKGGKHKSRKLTRARILLWDGQEKVERKLSLRPPFLVFNSISNSIGLL